MKTSFFKRSASDKAFYACLYALMLVFAFIVLYPFLYIAALSFNEGRDALKGGITIWPRAFTLENYGVIFREPVLLHAVLVSVSRTFIGTALSVMLAGLVGFCFTKPNLIGRKFYTVLFMLPMYITAGLIPTFLTYRLFNLNDSFLVYIVPNLIWGYNIIIMRTFFYSLPQSLEESAVIDGASEYTVYFRVIMPLSAAVFATIALFDAVWHWNYWFDTVMYTRSRNLDTLISLLSKMLMENQASQISTLMANRRAQAVTPEVLKSAMTMVTTIPIVMVYPFLQKYFIKGVMVGAVKG